MKIYISGPMTGMDDMNRPAFAAAAVKLIGEGHEIVNPHDVRAFVAAPIYFDWLKADIAAMMRCSGIYMLKGFEKSTGAMIEHDLAHELHFTMLYEDDES